MIQIDTLRIISYNIFTELYHFFIYTKARIMFHLYCIISYDHISYSTRIVMLQRKYEICIYSIYLYRTLDFCHWQNFYWYFTSKSMGGCDPSKARLDVCLAQTSQVQVKEIPASILILAQDQHLARVVVPKLVSLAILLFHRQPFFFFSFFWSYYLSFKQTELNLEWTVLDSSQTRTSPYLGFAQLESTPL